MRSFSQIDTATKRNDTATLPKIISGQMIPLPDSILRQAAVDIVKGDGCMLQLENRNKDILLLNDKISKKDNDIASFKGIVNSYVAIHAADSVKYNNELAVEKQLKRKYTVLKTNDRLKMGLLGTIIVGLVYIYIEKK